MSIFIPRDPYLLNPNFKLQDMIEDHLEKLERMIYHVSFVSIMDPFSILYIQK